MSAADIIIDAERCWRTGQMLAAIQQDNGPFPVIYADSLDELETRLIETGQMHLADEIAIDIAYWISFGKVWRP